MPNRIKYIRAPGIPKTPIGEEPGFTLPEGGKAGQVLISDGNGGASWATIQNVSDLSNSNEANR